jgi:hypothetical protein
MSKRDSEELDPLIETVALKHAQIMEEKRRAEDENKIGVMSKRELEEEDPLIQVIAVKEAKREAKIAEERRRKVEFLAFALPAMRTGMAVPEEKIENLIDSYEQQLIESNHDTKNVKLHVDLLMNTVRGPSEIAIPMHIVCAEYFNLASKGGIDAEQELIACRNECFQVFREALVAAWNKRHPKLPAVLDKGKVWMIISSVVAGDPAPKVE